MPNLCNLKELRSCLFATWNCRGDKWAVGGSSGHVFIGTYNVACSMWIAFSQTEEPPQGRPLHKASVMQVRFDPLSGRALASASADGQVIITSAYKPEVDDADTGSGPFAGLTAEFGEILFRLKTNVWNNTIAWSPSGETLAFASHDCELHFAEFNPDLVAQAIASRGKAKPETKRVVYNGNPILNGTFINETTYVGCGYDNAPIVFKKQGDGSWAFA